MVIAINAQHLLKNRLEGLGWFTYETIKRVVLSHPEHQFLFIFDRAWDEEFIFADNIIPVKTALQSRHPILWYLRFEWCIPGILKKYNADVFVSTDGWTTLWKGIRKLTVIHDINFVHQPKNIRWSHRKYYNYFFKRFATESDCLATVSEYSKTDIVSNWNIPSEKIDVIYNGCNETYAPINQLQKFNVKKHYTNGSDYFIYIGSLNPRKNIPSLLKAFEQFKKKQNSDIKLLLVGQEMWHQKDILETLSKLKHKNEIIFTGRKSNSELHQLLAGAMGLLLVSYQEGFGIPVIEAFNCRIPVICSNVTSLPEVAGDAALYIDPYSISSIAEAMSKLSNNPILQKELMEKGDIQKKKFSWDTSADRLWNCIKKCSDNENKSQ